MDKEQIREDLRDLAAKIRSWDFEDVSVMYAWMIQVNELRKALGDNDFVVQTVKPYDLPVGSSPAPKNMQNVWTWDNHGRYIVGKHWNEDMLRIRRFDELDVE